MSPATDKNIINASTGKPGGGGAGAGTPCFPNIMLLANTVKMSDI